MKYCTHCGAEIRDEAIVCVNMGAPLSREVRSRLSSKKMTQCKPL